MNRTAQRCVVVGVFAAGHQAHDALRNLRATGFSAQQVGLALRYGELMETSGTLEAVDVPEHDLLGGLIGMGVPVAPARVCAREFERGRAIVAVQPQERMPDAARLLHQAGAMTVLTRSPVVSV
jgi:hypothetical protein